MHFLSPLQVGLTGECHSVFSQRQVALDLCGAAESDGAPHLPKSPQAECLSVLSVRSCPLLSSGSMSVLGLSHVCSTDLVPAGRQPTDSEPEDLSGLQAGWQAPLPVVFVKCGDWESSCLTSGPGLESGTRGSGSVQPCPWVAATVVRWFLAFCFSAWVRLAPLQACSAERRAWLPTHYRCLPAPGCRASPRGAK